MVRSVSVLPIANIIPILWLHGTWLEIFEACHWVQDIDGLVQDCSNSSAVAMELLQSCTKPSIWACICLVTSKYITCLTNMWIPIMRKENPKIYKVPDIIILLPWYMIICYICMWLQWFSILGKDDLMIVFSLWIILSVHLGPISQMIFPS